MHTYISLCKRALDEYNDNATDDSVTNRMMNTIVLAMIVENEGVINKEITFMTMKMNFLWKKYMNYKIKGMDYIKPYHELSKYINENKEKIFKMINKYIELRPHDDFDNDFIDYAWQKGIIGIEVRL